MPKKASHVWEKVCEKVGEGERRGRCNHQGKRAGVTTPRESKGNAPKGEHQGKVTREVRV